MKVHIESFLIGIFCAALSAILPRIILGILLGIMGEFIYLLLTDKDLWK